MACIFFVSVAVAVDENRYDRDEAFMHISLASSIVGAADGSIFQACLSAVSLERRLCPSAVDSEEVLLVVKAAGSSYHVGIDIIRGAYDEI